MLTTKLEILQGDDDYCVVWTESDDAGSVSGTVGDSRRWSEHDVKAVLEEMHYELAAANIEIRPEGTDVPMVVVSASASEVERATGRRLGT